ncbi:MAG: universal stress protein [Parvibaculum sp.]|nr:universal stress protein [Parvibaculum sp.]
MSAGETADRLAGLRNILIATDLSGRSEKAVVRGLSLAARFGARAVVVHAVDDDQPPSLVDVEAERSAALLNEMLAPLAVRFGIQPEVRILRGIESEAIRLAADEIDADLLVLGAHRRQILRDVFTGTTVERVIRTSGQPVLVARLDGDESYRTAIAAIDLSQPSLDAFRFASGVSFLGCREVTLLHAFLSLAGGMMRYADVGENRIDEYSGSLADEARGALDHVLEAVPSGEVDARIEVTEGAAIGVIKEAMSVARPQLVVLGTRGNSSLKSLLLGSVANAILRDAECDVLAWSGRRPAA